MIDERGGEQGDGTDIGGGRAQRRGVEPAMWQTEADWVGLADDGATDQELTDDGGRLESDEADPNLEADDDSAVLTVPLVAIVGRPNVGKSTLVNRILGRREAVVEDVPGVTRDRVMYDAEWTGTRFTLVDTGGWEVDATGIHLRVAEQAEIAIELADAVMFVVDATVGATDTDDAVV